MIQRDWEGNYIYYCPRCKAEYTVPPFTHAHATINFHCDVRACSYALLVAKELTPAEHNALYTNAWLGDDSVC